MSDYEFCNQTEEDIGTPEMEFPASYSYYCVQVKEVSTPDLLSLKKVIEVTLAEREER